MKKILLAFLVMLGASSVWGAPVKYIQNASTGTLFTLNVSSKVVWADGSISTTAVAGGGGGDTSAISLATGTINADLQSSKSAIAVTTTTLQTNISAVNIATGTIQTTLLSSTNTWTAPQTFISSITASTMTITGQIVLNDGTVLRSTSTLADGSGYAVEPATVPFQLDAGFDATVATITAHLNAESDFYVSKWSFDNADIYSEVSYPGAHFSSSTSRGPHRIYGQTVIHSTHTPNYPPILSLVASYGSTNTDNDPLYLIPGDSSGGPSGIRWASQAGEPLGSIRHNDYLAGAYPYFTISPSSNPITGGSLGIGGAKGNGGKACIAVNGPTSTTPVCETGSIQSFGYTYDGNPVPMIYVKQATDNLSPILKAERGSQTTKRFEIDNMGNLIWLETNNARRTMLKPGDDGTNGLLTLVLPTSSGTVGQFLQYTNQGTGQMEWATTSGGGSSSLAVTAGVIRSSPTSDIMFGDQFSGAVSGSTATISLAPSLVISTVTVSSITTTGITASSILGRQITATYNNVPTVSTVIGGFSNTNAVLGSTVTGVAGSVTGGAGATAMATGVNGYKAGTVSGAGHGGYFQALGAAATNYGVWTSATEGDANYGLYVDAGLTRLADLASKTCLGTNAAGVVIEGTCGGVGGGGYDLEPSTVTIQANLGILASTLTVTNDGTDIQGTVLLGGNSQIEVDGDNHLLLRGSRQLQLYAVDDTHSSTIHNASDESDQLTIEAVEGIDLVGPVTSSTMTISGQIVLNDGTIIRSTSTFGGTGSGIVATDSPTWSGQHYWTNAEPSTMTYLVVTGTLSVSGSGAGVLTLTEGTAPSGVASKGVLYADSTAHWMSMKNNNGDAYKVAGTSTTPTAGKCASWSAAGSLIAAADACGTGTSGGSGYDIEPATVAVIVSTLTVNSSMTVTNVSTLTFTNVALEFAGTSTMTFSGVAPDFRGNFLLTGEAGTSGQVLTSGGAGTTPTWAAGGGGGSSSLAVWDGTVKVSSPTESIRFVPEQFSVSLLGSGTAYVAVDGSSVTMLGPSIDLATEVTGVLPYKVSASTGLMGGPPFVSSYTILMVSSGTAAAAATDGIPVPGITWTLPAGTTAWFDIEAMMDTGLGTTAPQLAMEFTATPATFYYQGMIPTGSDAINILFVGAGTASLDWLAPVNYVGTNIISVNTIRGFIVTGADEGILRLRMRSEGGSVINARPGTYGELRTYSP